jgi:hypothetical protein
MTMARVEIQETGTEVIYRLLPVTNATGEEFDDLPAATLPPSVAENLGLVAHGYNADGTVAVYVRYVIGPTQESHEKAPVRPVEPPQGIIRALDGTSVPQGFDWRLDALPLAVKECNMEMRGQGKVQYISEKYPATSKAQFREDEHRRAVVFSSGVEIAKKKDKRAA